MPEVEGVEKMDIWMRLHYESGQVPLVNIRQTFREAGYDLAPGVDTKQGQYWRSLLAWYRGRHPGEQAEKDWAAFFAAAGRLGYRPVPVDRTAQEDTTGGFGEATDTVSYSATGANEDAPNLAPRAEARERVVGQTLSRFQWLSSDDGIATPPMFQGDVGVDLSTTRWELIEPGKVTYCGLGVRFAAPPGAWILLIGRSSLASKLGLAMVPGIIDNGYRGEMFAGLYPIGPNEVELGMGTRVAQAILIPMFPTHLVQVEELPPSDRGENGFGSTGGH